ncbi:MAG TPA: UTP--glucose-1-phosphate uridylyltransferase [Candidatus Binataceae bacterium]|nr:UTP--glucose-1-phosphate uridylyltransferase [Candidatus Binataceae bacterium]
MRVKKAVILAAGFGTRMLPASKAIPKEILPVVDTPAIQLVVEEVVKSGIREIIFVISPGRTTVLNHFTSVPELEEHLRVKGRTDLLELVHYSSNLARITAVEQREPRGLGHAVLQARAAVSEEPFAVLLPDDIFSGTPPCLRQLLDVAEERDAPVVALLKVAYGELSKYGIVAGDKAGERLFRLSGMVEKPAPEKAPSDLAIMGRYVLPPEIFALLEHARPGVGGEIQLTDALMKLSQRRPLYGYQVEGTRYDLGDRLGFIQAQIGYGLQRPDLADKLRAYLESLIGPR